MRGRGRAQDWAATPLGAVASWSPTLRAAVRLCLDCARPMCVFAGPDLIAIYNDAYASAVGTVRHPEMFARPAREGWRDIWDRIGPEYEQVMAGGPAVERLADGRYVSDRGRGPEESYWTYATSAIRDDDGRIVGCHTLITETTDRVRAEAALREREARYRELFEMMAQGYADIELVRDADGRAVDQHYLALNPAFERIFGIPVAQAVGRRQSELFPGSEPWWNATFERVARSGVPERIEHEDASLGRWYEMWAYPRGGDRLTVMYQDVTERKRADANETLLARITDDLTRLVTPDEIIQAVGARLGAVLNIEVCTVAEVNEERDEVAVRHVWRRDGALNAAPQTYRLADYWVDDDARVHRAGETIVVSDTAVDERTDADTYLALGVRSFVSVPFRRRGQWEGTFSVIDASPRDWRPDEIKLVQAVTERVFPRIERARAEAAVRESEEQFRRSIEEAPIPVIMHAEDGEVLQISRTWTELTGYSLDDVPTFDAWLTRAYGEGADTVREHVHALFEGAQRTMSVEFPVRTLAGEVRHWSFSASAPGTLRDGRRFVVGMALDVNARRRAEEALRASEEGFRTMTDLVPDLLWQSEPDGSTPWYNARWLEYSGQTLEQAQGWGWTDAIHPDDRARSAANYARAAERGVPLVQEHRIRRYDGAYRWFLIRAEPLRDETGHIVRWFGAATDIHAQRMALEEAERLATERTAERDALRRQLGEAEEAERRRLARELHDQLGQQVTAIALGLEDARRLADDVADEPLLARLTQLKEIAHAMSMSARYVALELRPPELDDVGFASALETYVREWSARYGVEADAVVSGAARHPVAADVATALYRIVQEALTNVAKHAAAKHVSVSVDRADAEVRLVIEDDGRGFDLSEATARARRERRLGLAGIQERVALLGGELTVESVVGAGTTVLVRVPVGEDQASP